MHQSTPNKQRSQYPPTTVDQISQPNGQPECTEIAFDERTKQFRLGSRAVNEIFGLPIGVVARYCTTEYIEGWGDYIIDTPPLDSFGE